MLAKNKIRRTLKERQLGQLSLEVQMSRSGQRLQQKQDSPEDVSATRFAQQNIPEAQRLFLMEIERQVSSSVMSSTHSADDKSELRTAEILQPSYHCAALWANVYLAICFLVGIEMMWLRIIADNPYLLPSLIMLQAYIIYMVVCLKYSEYYLMIRNMQWYSYFTETYKRLVESPPRFPFCITKKQNNSAVGQKRIGIELSSLRGKYSPGAWIDESQTINVVHDQAVIVWMRWNSKFCFGSQTAKTEFYRSFRRLVGEHADLQRIQISTQYEPTVLQPVIVFSNRNPLSIVAGFALFTALGLSFPYCAITEKFIRRYDLTIIKKILG